MKKYIVGLLCVVALFMVSALTPKTAEAATQTIIETIDNIPVYDNRTGTLIKAGTLMENQTFLVTADYGTNWWQIRWGENYGFVRKDQVRIVPVVTYRNGIGMNAKPKTYIKPTVIADVYDNITYAPNLNRFATLEPQMTFPIQSKMGNWFGIELNGRLGYVHNLQAVEVQAPVNPFAKKMETTAYTPVYDFRRPDNAMVIAHLYAGQQIEVLKKEDAYSEKYAIIRWGKTYAYIDKNNLTEVINDKVWSKADDTKVRNEYFIPTGDSRIFDKTSGNFLAFARLDTNRRYPILRKEGDWLVTTLGGRQGYIHKNNSKMDRGVPVLMYHHVLRDNELGYFKNKSTTVTENQFRNEMAHLKNLNYEAVTIYELQQFLRGEITLPAYSVVITFDDGLLSTKQYAYPILKQNGFKAAQFLITHRTNTSADGQQFNPNTLQNLSWGDVDSMRDVFNFEGHTHDLHNLLNGKTSNVLTVSYRDLVADLQSNIAAIGGSPKALAYPFGQYNKNTIQATKDAGFTMGFTTRWGYNLPYQDIFQINRVSSNQSVSLEAYKRMVLPYN